jgi:hypothetical protein
MPVTRDGAINPDMRYLDDVRHRSLNQLSAAKILKCEMLARLTLQSHESQKGKPLFEYVRALDRRAQGRYLFR